MRISVRSSILALLLLGTICSARGCFDVWQQDRVLGRHPDPLSWIRTSPDGKWVASNSPKECRIWSTTGGTNLLLPPGQRNLAFAPVADKLLVRITDGGVALWDLRAGTCGKPFGREHGPAREGVFSPDGRLVVTAFDYTDKLIVWDAAAGKQVASLKGSPSYGTMRFSADGKLLLWPGECRAVWDTESWEPVSLTLPDRASVYAFSPSGMEYLRSDGNILEVLSGRILAKLDDFKMGDCRFVDDGKRVEAWFGDGTARIWNAQTGRVQTTWRWGTPPTASWTKDAFGARMLMKTPRAPDLWRAAASQPPGAQPCWWLAHSDYEYTVWDESGSSLGALGPGVSEACFCGSDRLIAAAGPGETCGLWTQHRPLSWWGVLVVPATWMLLLMAAGLAWSLARDWKARDQATGTYAPIGAALLTAAWAGLLALLVVHALAAPSAKDVEQLFALTLQFGFPAAMAVAATASLRGLTVRTAALFAPLLLGTLVVFVARASSSGSVVGEGYMALSFLAAALAVGVVAGLTKRRRKGVVLGIIGGILGAGAAVLAVIKLEGAITSMSLLLILYLPVAAMACQLCIAVAMKLVPEPRESGGGT